MTPENTGNTIAALNNAEYQGNMEVLLDENEIY